MNVTKNADCAPRSATVIIIINTDNNNPAGRSAPQVIKQNIAGREYIIIKIIEAIFNKPCCDNLRSPKSTASISIVDHNGMPRSSV